MPTLYRAQTVVDNLPSVNARLKQAVDEVVLERLACSTH